MANECHLIAKTSIDGIPANPAYEEEIEIKYKIGEDGILYVQATSITDEKNQKTLTVGQEKVTLPEEELLSFLEQAEKERASEETNLELERMDSRDFFECTPNSPFTP